MCEKCEKDLREAEAILFQFSAYIPKGKDKSEVMCSFTSHPESWSEDLKQSLTLSEFERLIDEAIVYFAVKKVETQQLREINEALTRASRAMEN